MQPISKIRPFLNKNVCKNLSLISISNQTRGDHSPNYRNFSHTNNTHKSSSPEEDNCFSAMKDAANKFRSIKYWTEDRVAHVMLNRPERLNAIDLHMPCEIQKAIQIANWDDKVRVILLYGAGNAFCSGYDLKLYAEAGRGAPGSQEMPWDPAIDFRIMSMSTNAFMEIWRSMKPVVAKIKRVGIGGGSDMSMACDVTFIEDNAQFGYPPSRVWGCPTTAFWFYRIGIEKAKRILFTGQILSGKEAVSIGLLGESCSSNEIDKKVDQFIEKIVTVPFNQLWYSKQMINHAVEEMGLLSTQRLATVFDGMSRHSPEGIAFQQRSQQVGFKQAVQERDSGKDVEWSDLTKKS